MPFEWPTDGLAAGGIPEPQGVVLRAGDDATTIGAEGDGCNPPVPVSFKRSADGLAGGGIPEAHAGILGPGHDAATIGAEDGGGDLGSVALEGHTQRLACDAIPKPEGVA